MKALAFALSQLKRYPELQTLEPAQFSSHTVGTVAGAFQVRKMVTLTWGREKLVSQNSSTMNQC